MTAALTHDRRGNTTRIVDATWTDGWCELRVVVLRDDDAPVLKVVRITEAELSAALAARP